MKIYPAIDLLDSKCVRLSQGDFDRKKDYSDNPIEVAQSFEKAGAKYLHVVDLDASRKSVGKEGAVIRSILKNTSLKVQVAGGVRSAADVEERLSWGAERVVIGSLAANKPEEVVQMLARFGGDRITISIDVKKVGNEYRVFSHGWEKETRLTPVELIQKLEGIDSLLCTDIGRDGMETGVNVGLYAAIQRDFPRLKIQASGGVGSLENIREARRGGFDACIVGRALYEKRFTLEEALNVE